RSLDPGGGMAGLQRRHHRARAVLGRIGPAKPCADDPHRHVSAAGCRGFGAVLDARVPSRVQDQSLHRLLPYSMWTLTFSSVLLAAAYASGAWSRSKRRVTIGDRSSP